MEEEGVGREGIDWVYRGLKNGIGFEKVGEGYMKNVLGCGYWDGEWIGERCVIKEFREELRRLKKGNYCGGFFCGLGIDMVYLLDEREGVYG